jgi:hypothetical protein
MIFLDYRSRRLLGHVVAAASELAAAYIGRDDTHRVEQRCADAGLRAERQHRHGELPLGARAAVLDPFRTELVPIVGKRSSCRAGAAFTRTYSSRSAGVITQVRVHFARNSQVRNSRSRP